jgi:hypothetical protein
VDPSFIPAELARVRAGTRVRLFHRNGADRVATSGSLRSVRAGEVTIAPDEGGELTVALAAVTCFYVPKPFRGRAAAVASLRAALQRLVPSLAWRPPGAVDAPRGDPVAALEL